MTSAYRTNISKVLTVIYLMITLSPLAPLALHSAVIAHAVTGECSGDCSICGCAAERSATHTCCCWQKKLRNVNAEKQQELPACCKKKQRTSRPVASCSDRPCGSGKLVAFWGGESLECLLDRNATDLSIPRKNTLEPSPYRRLIDRYVDPPDPPPKLITLS